MIRMAKCDRNNESLSAIFRIYGLGRLGRPSPQEELLFVANSSELA